MTDNIISKIFYNKESENWGKYKVIEFIEERGKTKVSYYRIKFQKTGNIIEAPLKTILEDRVVDIEAQKKQTRKKIVEKKKSLKKSKCEAKRFVLNMKDNPRLLALDLSTHSTGYAVFIDNKLFEYNYIYQPKTVKWDTKRINFMFEEVKILIKKHKINVVAMEDVIFKHKIALYVLSKLQGVVANCLYKNNIPFCIITPREWKSEYNINRDSTFGKNTREESKLKTVACVNKDFGLNLESEFSNSPSDLKEPCYYDVSDAIALGFIALKNRIK